MTARVPVRRGARVLVAEDDPELLHLFSVILSDLAGEVILARTGAEAEARLAEGDVDLVVLELVLPDMDGRSLLRRLRGGLPTATVPVIVLTTRLTPDLRAECYDRGADAVVEKPFDLDVFQNGLAQRLERAAAMEREAYQDDLTGLRNLAGFLADLEEAPPSGGALLLVEIDGVRRVSTDFGWATGEMVMARAGHALAAAIPHRGTLARLSGGEFGMLVAGADAAALAEETLETVRTLPVSGPDGETFRLTASAATLPLAAESDPATLLDDVRDLVRRAQAEGGNRWVSPEAPAPDLREDRPLLLAEDDDITATILVHRLAREGFRVNRYDNGPDAYQGALAETPCVAILDVKMPGMDGLELLQRLRKTPSFAHVPIMMLTSMGSEADIVRGFQLGADDYMLKPFSPTELLARLKRLVRRAPAAATD